MKEMVEQWNLETRGCPDTSSFKGKFTKQTERLRGKTKGPEGKRESGAGGTHDRASQAARPCVHHHRSWWTPWAARGGSCSLVLSLPKRYVLLHVWSTCFACVALFWATFAVFFDVLGPQKYFLILWFRLVNLNSAKILKTSKTTHNRRNRGTNHIIIQSPKMTPKYLINPCKYSTHHLIYMM